MSFVSSIQSPSRGLLLQLLLLTILLFGVAGSLRAADMADIIILPGTGQSADQLRRDRYECHNWVLAQSGAVPPSPASARAADRDRRANRIGKVITGAAVGAAAGSIIRGARDYREADEGALAGGVLGAIAGAVIGGRQEREREDESFGDYARGLSACMTARGYTVSLPSD